MGKRTISCWTFFLNFHKTFVFCSCKFFTVTFGFGHPVDGSDCGEGSDALLALHYASRRYDDIIIIVRIIIIIISATINTRTANTTRYWYRRSRRPRANVFCVDIFYYIVYNKHLYMRRTINNACSRNNWRSCARARDHCVMRNNRVKKYKKMQKKKIPHDNADTGRRDGFA